MTINDTAMIKIMNATQTIADHISKQNDLMLWGAVISAISGFGIYAIVFYQPIRTKIDFAVHSYMILKKLTKLNSRNVIVMAHRESGLFGSMITMEDIIKIEKFMRKFANNGKGIDLILHTFGGELFASMRLALLIKNHADIHVYVPKYAWSGGSLATLASNNIHMGKLSTLSPVDAQLGNLLKSFSAKYWKSIVAQKGKKCNDDTIAMAELSSQILDEQKQFLEELLKDNPNVNKEKFFDLFLTGAVTHGKQITPQVLKDMGFNVSEISSSLYDELIESSKRNGVFAKEFKEKKHTDTSSNEEAKK